MKNTPNDKWKENLIAGNTLKDIHRIIYKTRHKKEYNRKKTYKDPHTGRNFQ